MPRPHLFAHFLPPLMAAVVGLLLGLRTEPLSASAAAALLLGGSLYYATPHIPWAGLLLLFKPKRAVAHAGFIVCTFSLLAVASLSFVGRDPSGLPYQWLVYWPLPGLLLLLLLLAWLTSGRQRADA